MIDPVACEVAGVCAGGPPAEKDAQTQPTRSGFLQSLHLAQADDGGKLRALTHHGFRRRGSGLHGAGHNVCRDLAQIDILVSRCLVIKGHSHHSQTHHGWHRSTRIPPIQHIRKHFFYPCGQWLSVSLVVRFYLAVPPTVMRSSLSVGIPTPTGTDWPSFPQVPTPSSSCRSLPTMETLVNASGPLPIRVQFLSGAPTLPSSIK